MRGFIRLSVLTTLFVSGCGTGRDPSLDPYDTTDQSIVGGVAAPTSVTNVGTIVWKYTEADAEWSWSGCSGTLISPTAFLTAGHCLFGWQNLGIHAWGVTFAPAIELSEDGWSGVVPAGAKVYQGTPIVHPAFSWDLLGDYRSDELPDQAVILFDHPVRGIHTAALPPVGYISRFKDVLMNLNMGMAGYGLTTFAPFNGNGTPDWGVRRYTTTKLVDVYPNMIETGLTPGDGCVQDSGGPLFTTVGALGGPVPPPRVVLQVLAIVRGPTHQSPGGDLLCSNGTTLTRLDTDLAHSFLDQFVR
jgi:trypsin